MPAFGPSGGSSGGGSGGGPELDPSVHIVRELIIVETSGILILTSPAIVLVTDGNLGKYMRVHTSSTVEFQ